MPPSLAGSHEHGATENGGRGDVGGGLRTALIITSSVMVLEFVGGMLSNSLALMADAGHMLTDAGALGLSYFAFWFSSRPATPQKTYGFYRVEILAALLNGSLLVLVALLIFREAWARLMLPPAVDANLMLLVASGGLIANVASAFVLFRRRSDNLNIRSAFFHVSSDALGSLGAIVASLVIMLFDWRAADAVISGIVAVLILCSAWILIRDAVDILLEGAPAHINLKSLKDHIVQAGGVHSVHDLHVWTLTSGVVAMSCHVVVDLETSQQEVLTRVCGIAEDRFRIGHATVQIEPADVAAGISASCSCQFGAH